MDSSRKCPSERYRWTVVLCSFINHMATTGFIISLSVMYVSWLEEFKEGNGRTSWILSLEFALHIGFSPVTALLAARFGFWGVAFVGGLVTGLGLAISAFATSVIFLIVSIGLVSGIGCSFCFLPPYAMISLIFDKRRSLAIGIATMGVGVGAFAFSPVIAVLIKMYAWRGALLVLSAISLHMCATGLLLRPVQISGKDTDEKHEETIPIQSSTLEEKKDDIDEDEKRTFQITALSHEQSMFPELINDNNITAFGCNEYTNTVPLSNGRNTLFVSSTSDGYQNNRQKIRPKDLHPKTVISPYLSLPNLAQHQTKKRLYHSSADHLYKADIALLAGVNSFCANSKECVIRNETVDLQTSLVKSNSYKCNSNASKTSNSWFSGLLSWLSEMTRLKLFQDKMFLLFCVSNLLSNISLLAPVMYLVDRAIHHGIDSSIGAIIISANGVGNILGRLLTGLVASDGCCSNRTFLYIVGMCANGLGTLLSPICGDMPILHGIYASYFGFHIGAYMVLMPMVTVELNGVSNLASVIGQVLAFHGIGILIGPPISGWLFDWTKSYTMSYIVNGAVLIISGLMLVPLLWRADNTNLREQT